MAYVKTLWVDTASGGTKINAASLNKAEVGVLDAHTTGETAAAQVSTLTAAAAAAQATADSAQAAAVAAQATANAAVAKSVATTKGDLLAATGAGILVRRPVGAEARTLIASAAEASGISYGPRIYTAAASTVVQQHHSGGLKLRVPQTYGQYELRVRASYDLSQVTSGVVLLWPESNQWPEGGEIDWWETYDNRDTRTPVKSYVHRLNPAATPPYDPSDDQVVATTIHAGVDQSDWHKIVCSWRPGELAIEIDNGTPVVITSDPSHIPDWPMEMALQLDAWSDTPPSVPVEMDIDYILLRPYETGNFGTAVYFNQFDTLGPASSVLDVEWEIYDSPGNAGFGLRSPGQIQVVTEASSTSGGNVLRITAESKSSAEGSAPPESLNGDILFVRKS